MNLSTSVDSLTHLYDRIVDAVNVLLNFRMTVTKGRNNSKIDGYLDVAGVRDCSLTEEEYLEKSNAIFALRINPELIACIANEGGGLYHFNHCWLYMRGTSQNAYVAAKRLGRHFSQNTYHRNYSSSFVQMKIGTLRKHLPGLNNKREKDNRASLDRALAAIPGAKWFYMSNHQSVAFEKLTALRLRTVKYNTVKVAILFNDHPNTSKKKVTTDLIHRMNDDALYAEQSFFLLDEADRITDRRGAVGNSPKKNSVPEEENVP